MTNCSASPHLCVDHRQFLILIAYDGIEVLSAVGEKSPEGALEAGLSGLPVARVVHSSDASHASIVGPVKSSQPQLGKWKRQFVSLLDKSYKICENYYKNVDNTIEKRSTC